MSTGKDGTPLSHERALPALDDLITSQFLSDLGGVGHEKVFGAPGLITPAAFESLWLPDPRET